MTALPWGKFRIAIQSDQIRAIPKSVSELFGIISNQSEELFVSRLMRNVQKATRLNPIQSE